MTSWRLNALVIAALLFFLLVMVNHQKAIFQFYFVQMLLSVSWLMIGCFLFGVAVALLVVSLNRKIRNLLK